MYTMERWKDTMSLEGGGRKTVGGNRMRGGKGVAGRERWDLATSGGSWSMGWKG